MQDETIHVQASQQEDEELKPLFDAIVAGKLEPAVEVTKKAIEKLYGDFNTWLDNQIEVCVNEAKA